MIRAIALAQHMLPVELVERQALATRIYQRGGEVEYQFDWHHWHRVLPIWDEGRLRLVAWGVARGERSSLPIGGAARLGTVAGGSWPALFRPVEVPCALARENGVWTLIREGLQAIVSADEAGVERAWLLVEPSSYYWRIMTRSDWMPVLVNERF